MKILILIISVILAIVSISSFTNGFEQESHTWKTFLLEVDEKLSQYEIQRDASRYNVANLTDWAKENKPQGLSIHRNNFHQFLDTLNIGGDIRNVELTDSRLRDLNHVLAITLRNTYKEIIDGNKIILRGRFIKFSDFIDDSAFFRDPSKFTSRNISIFATKTLFIDRSLLAFGSQLNISLIAPTWEVFGHRVIIVAGAEERSTFTRAEDGYHAGSNGENGKEGLPGGAAGNVFGIGKVFINGDRLTIRAEGGRGGPGQDGGHGAKGRDGQVVTIEQLNDRKFVSLNKKKNSIKVHDLWDRAKDYGYEVECGKGSNCNQPDKTNCECAVWGKRGGRGGDGGKGGAGGVGGKAGKVVIEELGGNTSGIKVSNGNGELGPRGQGGLGGDGGSCNKLRVSYYQRAYKSGYWRSFQVSIGFLRDEPINDKGSDGDGRV